MTIQTQNKHFTENKYFTEPPYYTQVQQNKQMLTDAAAPVLTQILTRMPPLDLSEESVRAMINVQSSLFYKNKPANSCEFSKT